MRRHLAIALLLALGLGASTVVAQPGAFGQLGGGQLGAWGLAPQNWGAPPVAPVAVPVPQVDPHREELTRIDTRLDALDAEISALRAQRERGDALVRERGRALYRVKRSGMLPIGGGFDAMVQHLARVERLERIVVRAMQRDGELARRVGVLAAEREELQASRSEVQARSDNRAAAIAAATPTPFEQVLQQGPVSAPADGFGLRVHGGPVEGFASQRGRLAMPVRSGGNISDAQREDGRGLEFQANAGAVVQSVGEGHVAYAEPYGEYGSMVIVDHGNRYFSVYASLAHVAVERGQWVGASHTLGYSGGAHPVYFEVRRGTRSLSPRRWLGL